MHIPLQHVPHPYDDGYAVDADTADLSPFVSALRKELRSHTDTHAVREPMSTLHIGGGRPSLLPLGSIHSLLRTFIDIFDTSVFEEATAETYPADATTGYLRGLQRMGINRVHLPVLSFFPSALQAIDAPHTAAEAVRAIRRVEETGFDSLSIDLLFGRPDQTLSDWRAVLQLAVGMDLPHLTLIEATNNLGPTASDEVIADQLEFAIRFLQSEGYNQYELTHFAKDGHSSLHQKNYYAHGNQLGAGPSAESFWWPRRNHPGNAHRWANVADLDEYVSLLNETTSPVAYRETLDRIELAREYIMLRLRTRAGLDLDHLCGQYGVDLPAERGDELDQLRDKGLIHWKERTVRLTNQGVLKADAITQRLLPAA